MGAMIAVAARDYAVLIRGPRESDSNYVASTWARGLYAVDKRKSVAEHGQLPDQLLNDATVRVLIACEPTATDTILGWIAWSPIGARRVLHYVYVRDKVRRRGIAWALASEAGSGILTDIIDRGSIAFTTRGPDARALEQKYRGHYITPEEFLAP